MTNEQIFKALCDSVDRLANTIGDLRDVERALSRESLAPNPDRRGRELVDLDRVQRAITMAQHAKRFLRDVEIRFDAELRSSLPLEPTAEKEDNR